LVGHLFLPLPARIAHIVFTLHSINQLRGEIFPVRQ
jgi:hypothetical protein